MVATRARRYDMPVIFGPSHIGERSNIPRASAHTISFETSREAAASLMPPYFQVADRPVVTYARMTYENVDYLGGRSYRELVFSIRAIYSGDDQRIEAGFIPVLWVDDYGALTAGRELQGLAKLGAILPPVAEEEDGWRFDCYEFDALLFEGRLWGVRQLDSTELERVNRAAGEVASLGWKYIPGLGETPDVDYPTLSVMRWKYDRAWTGTGSMTVHAPDALAAPFSARVNAVLATLPVIGPVRSFAGLGSAEIDRAATRRLPSSQT